MARIVGVDLPKNKRGEIGLTYIYGIGSARAAEVLAKTGISPDVRVKDLTEDQEALLREAIEHQYIGCYRGIRHRLGLPVRGQSTKNNARTRKGRKKTVANKKKATK